MATFATLSNPRPTRREVLGPGVGAVAVIASKPSAVPKDLIIIQRRQQEDMRRAAVESVESNKQFDFKVLSTQCHRAHIFPSVNGSKLQIRKFGERR